MRHLLTILAALFLCSAPLHAQTLKSLMFNSTNAQVVANTGTNVLTFTNGSIRVGDTLNYLDITAYGLSGIWPSSISLEESTLYGPDEWTIQAGANFGTNAATTRANLGFSTNLNSLWTATNTATAARVLSGSTNTNHPYSGSISVVGTNNTNTLVFSNGILQSVQ